MKKESLILVLLILSSALLRLNAQNSVIDSLEILLQQHQKQDTIRVNLLNETGYLIYSFNLEKSYKYAREASEISNKIYYLKGSAESDRIKGIYFGIKSNYPKALNYFHQALKKFEKLGDKIGISSSYNNFGMIYNLQHQYLKALEYHNKSLNLDKEVGNEKGLSYSLNNIGKIYHIQSNYSKALIYYQKSLKIKEKLNDKYGISYSYIGIGEIYFSQGNYPSALIYFQKALKISVEIGNTSVQTMSNIKLASLFLEQKKFQKAYSYGKRANKLANEIGSVDLISKSAELLAKSCSELGFFKEAYHYSVIFKTMNDSLFNKKTISESTGLEYQYKYEKEKQKAELIQQKKDAIHAEEDKRQKTIRNSLIIGFILMTPLGLVVFFSFLQKRRANSLLRQQKNEIENKSHELHKQNEEIQQLNEELNSSNDQLYNQKEELETTLSKLKTMQSQLILSEKMASVGIFTYGIAHEINNPLNYIVGGKYTIEKYIKENIKDHSANLMPSIEIIETGIQRVSNIVKSLNRFSQTNFTDKEECSIHSIIDNCLLLINKQTQNKIEINKKFTEVPNVVIGNEGSLHQVFLNILTNAVQAIKTKGIVSILTKIEKENLLIQISDTGTGISQENINKVTDPFYTTKDPGEGTGLGLSIALRIITEYKGLISFESTENTGTTVKVVLPVKITKP